MNWNDYIDKSYEWMLVCANDEGCVQAYGMPLDELRARIEDIAESAIIQKDVYKADKDVREIIFDDLAREDMYDSYWLGRFLDAVRNCHPVSADRIAQRCANEINIDCVYQYCLESLEE